MRATVDSNLLVYAITAQEGEKHHTAARLMTEAMFADVVLTAQALGEFLNVAARKYPEHLGAASAQAERWMAAFAIAETSAKHLLAAATFSRHHRLQYWDSVIWQAARSAGAAILLSEDMQDGLEIEGMTVLNPLEPKNGSRVREILER